MRPGNGWEYSRNRREVSAEVEVFEVAEDLVEIGIPIGPVTVSVNGLLRKVFGRRKERGQTEIVAERFLSLFGAHGVAVSQIQRLLPEVGLDKINTRDLLLGALNDKVLDRTARLFGVQREWLDGTVEEIYPYCVCHKRPGAFFKDIGELLRSRADFAVKALYCTKTLSAEDGRPQPVALLLAEQVTEFGDKEILRFRVYRDDWDWGYAPSRIQLKGMTRVVNRILGKCVPLYRVSRKEVDVVREGKMVPYACCRGPLLTEPSLEDFVLSPEESGCARECEELPAVLKYIAANDLENIARRLARFRN